MDFRYVLAKKKFSAVVDWGSFVAILSRLLRRFLRLVATPVVRLHVARMATHLSRSGQPEQVYHEWVNSESALCRD